MKLADAAWHEVVVVYTLVRALGVAGCALGVAAGLQVARWGLYLTTDEPDETAARPRARRAALGQLLQVCGSAFCAIAMVALVRQLVR
ncbi:hypothetical protein [Variovorax sp. OV329]|uniref:hypothetical protein n=1 Tax=Variovorax sp. OV329 TaxID=1882825 RepID=UPI0011146448|nr:hypothetical protein [Variovorax sp. OV329]